MDDEIRQYNEEITTSARSGQCSPGIKNPMVKELFKQSDPWGRVKSDRIDPLAIHFNKKYPVFNHPHRNYNTNGKNGDWTSIEMQDYVPPRGINAPEPKASNKAKRRGLDHGVEHIKAPTNKDSIYHCDYANWGKVPKSINLNPGLNKTVAENMPFFGRTSNTNYGGWGNDPDMLGTQANPTYSNKDRRKNPLGVDIPF